MSELEVLAAVLAVALVGAGLWRWREGRTVAVGRPLEDGTRERVGAPSDGPVLLLFTTPTCGNCAVARQVLDSLTADQPNVAITEVDVARHPSVAREYEVLRAPTVLVVDEGDEIRARISGVPNPAHLVDVLPR